MTEAAVREYVAAVRPRYRAASKRRKGRWLDEICTTTGRHRKSVIRALGQPAARPPRRRGRPRRYGPEVAAVLVPLWELSDRLCGKLLAPLLPDLLSALERHGELEVRPELRTALEALSPATVDRLLQPHRLPRRRAVHRPGGPTPTLKAQVPIRTFGEWRDVTPGALQADLVLHNGDRPDGFYLTTAVAVDVATGWTELQPVWGLGKQRVGTAVHHIRQRVPFPVQSLHTDNGGEFLNHVLVPWCRQEGIRFTRGRSYKKNDQAWVEQRNWLAVRRLVGYERYASKLAYAQLQALYPLLRLRLNFLRPMRKLVAKERQGATLRKHYDAAQTPYQRALTAGVLTADQAHALAAEFAALNPAALARQIAQALDKLWTLNDDAPRKQQRRAG